MGDLWYRDTHGFNNVMKNSIHNDTPKASEHLKMAQHVPLADTSNSSCAKSHCPVLLCSRRVLPASVNNIALLRCHLRLNITCLDFRNFSHSLYLTEHEVLEIILPQCLLYPRQLIKNKSATATCGQPGANCVDRRLQDKLRHCKERRAR